jgi:hypothetical protein
MRKKILGSDHSLVAESLHELGRAYQFNNSHDKALVCYKEALRLWRDSELHTERTASVSLDIVSWR